MPLRSLCGGVFAVLAAMWALLAAGAPKMGASTPDITSYYDNHGNRVKIGIATFLLMLAPVFLLWFLGRLEERLAHGCRRARTLHEGRLVSTARSARRSSTVPPRTRRPAGRRVTSLLMRSGPKAFAPLVAHRRCQPYGAGGGTSSPVAPVSRSACKCVTARAAAASRRSWRRNKASERMTSEGSTGFVPMTSIQRDHGTRSRRLRCRGRYGAEPTEPQRSRHPRSRRDLRRESGANSSTRPHCATSSRGFRERQFATLGEGHVCVAAHARPGGDTVASDAVAVALKRLLRDPRGVVSAARSAPCSITGLLADEDANDEQRQQQRRTSDVQPQR